jgi:hypothetical protein
MMTIKKISMLPRLSTPAASTKLLTRGLLLDYFVALEDDMNKDKLVEIIQDLLKTDHELSFLKELKKEDLETLVACIRDRIDQSAK